MMIECSKDFMSKGVKGGRRSVVIGFVVATVLVITVTSFVRSTSSALLCSSCLVLCISTMGGMINFVLVCVFVVRLRFSLIDDIFVKGSVISSIDEIFAEDKSEESILLLSNCTLKFVLIFCSN